MTIREDLDPNDDGREPCEECGILAWLNSGGVCPQCAFELGYEDEEESP